MSLGYLWSDPLRDLKINIKLLFVSKLVWNRLLALCDVYSLSSMFLPFLMLPKHNLPAKYFSDKFYVSLLLYHISSEYKNKFQIHLFHHPKQTERGYVQGRSATFFTQICFLRLRCYSGWCHSVVPRGHKNFSWS